MNQARFKELGSAKCGAGAGAVEAEGAVVFKQENTCVQIGGGFEAKQYKGICQEAEVKLRQLSIHNCKAFLLADGEATDSGLFNCEMGMVREILIF